MSTERVVFHVPVAVDLSHGVGEHRCECGAVRANADLFSEHQDAMAMRSLRRAALNNETITLFGETVWPK